MRAGRKDHFFVKSFWKQNLSQLKPFVLASLSWIIQVYSNVSLWEKESQSEMKSHRFDKNRGSSDEILWIRGTWNTGLFSCFWLTSIPDLRHLQKTSTSMFVLNNQEDLDGFSCWQQQQQIALSAPSTMAVGQKVNYSQIWVISLF